MDHKDKLAAVENYITAFEQADIEIIRTLYADDAVVEDPVGSEPHVGIDAILGFYKNALDSGAKLSLTGAPRGAGNAVAFPFECRLGEMSIQIIDVFEFDDAGKIKNMRAYWGPENMKA